ncbi:MAG: DUF805 domain-containing protein [Bacteroides sp.]|nr:DUF805 domain-containing protein [Bacteroides sp.]
MTLKEAVKICVGKKYADFSTRASRKEFWSFALFYWFLCLAMFMISILVDVVFEHSFQMFRLMVGVSVIIALLLMVPTYAVCVRRLHDTGRSGWWILLYFIPYIGAIALLIMLCRKSDEDNKYGPKPLL